MKETDKNKNIDKKEAKKAKKARKRGRAGRRIAQVLMCFLLTVAFVASAAGGAVAAYYKAATNTITTDTKTALKNADVVDADLEYETIAETFGIKLDGYVEVDMEAFREVVDLIGGVPMDLTEAEAYFLKTAYVNSKHGEKNVKAGENMLTPYQALAYCRIRQDITGEFGRTDRQRKILISVFNELKSEDVMTITNICMKALKYVTTDLTEKQIRSLLTSVITMGATEVEQFRIPYEGSYTEGRLSGNGAWVMQVDYEANKKALQYFVFGIGEDPGINDSYGVGNDKFIKGYYPEKTEGISTY